MTEQKNSKGLHFGLWVVQGLLAAALGMAGFIKITTPMDQLSEMAGITDVFDHFIIPTTSTLILRF